MRITMKPTGKKIVAINLRIDLDAVEIMKQHCPTPQGHGCFLARLLYEFEARREERERLKQHLEAALSPAPDHAA
jgi:hypothetical protein